MKKHNYQNPMGDYTTTRNIYRNGEYVGNVIIQKHQLTEEEYADLIKDKICYPTINKKEVVVSWYKKFLNYLTKGGK